MAVSNRNEIYKCSICGNVVAVAEVGGGELVCCGKPMDLLHEHTAEQEGREKHVPVVEAGGGKVTVKIGSVEHPMGKDHYIEFIQLLRHGIVIAEKQLTPGDKPEATFCIDDMEGVYAREYCNVHGLWKS